MKLLSALFVSALMTASAGVASANTINLDSYGSAASVVAPTGVGNTALKYTGGLLYGIIPVINPSSTTYDLPNTQPWAPATGNSSWVAQNSGDAPNGSHVETEGVYYFSSTFIDSDPTHSSGSILVMADDTTGVYLNGVQITPPAGFATTGTCASGAPTCTIPVSYSLNTADFVMGVNTLTFDVEQLHGSAEGLDFSGTVNVSGAASVTPEPDSLLLLGTGLTMMAGLVYYRRVLA